MKAIVVYESLWGNTADIARAIAEGIGPDVSALTTDEAVPSVVAEADFFVAGAPVLGFSLPTARMRDGIRSNPGSPPSPPDLAHPSMREWLDALPPGRGVSAALETRLHGPFPGSATKTIAERLQDKGYPLVARPVAFYVRGSSGRCVRGRSTRRGPGAPRSLAVLHDRTSGVRAPRTASQGRYSDKEYRDERGPHMAGFTDEQALRYVRQVTVSEVGAVGQERLLESSAVIVGAGGLGSPALLYLAAAGVSRIGVIDSDAVDLTNLQRQIAHRTADIGRNKAESAAETARALNPTVDVVAVSTRLDATNAMDLLAGYDVVLDCTDNFSTRYVINDACVLLGVPLVSASIMRFYGQLMTVAPRTGPCLRCLLPEPPAAGTVPTCAQTGVIGPVAGALGSLQAVEAIKVLLGLPGTLVGRLFVLDALTFDPEVLEIERDPDCAVCGDDPTILVPVDCGETCEGSR